MDSPSATGKSATPTVAAATNSTTPNPAAPTFDFLDLRAQFATIREEILAAVTKVMESQYFILGPEVKQFEDEIVAKLGGEVCH